MFISTNELINNKLQKRYEIYSVRNRSRFIYDRTIEKRMTKVTVTCQGGWKYTGLLSNEKLSPFGKLEWLEITTKDKRILINSPYIVSIIYDNNTKDRKGIS